MALDFDHDDLCPTHLRGSLNYDRWREQHWWSWGLGLVWVGAGVASVGERDNAAYNMLAFISDLAFWMFTARQAFLLLYVVALMVVYRRCRSCQMQAHQSATRQD